MQIEAPEHSRSKYFNYHGTFSIDVGCQGRISNGGVFGNTTFYKKLTRNELQLPNPTPLFKESNAQVIPFVLVADDAFALSTNLIKPFPGTHPKDSQKPVFNYRLSRARRIFENVFGLLVTVFRVFRRPIALNLKKVESVVLAFPYTTF